MKKMSKISMFELKKFQFVQFRGVFGLFLAKLFQMKLMRWRYQSRIVLPKLAIYTQKLTLLENGRKFKFAQFEDLSLFV